MDVVVGDGQDGAVVEQRQHHDHHRGDRVEVEDQDRQSHEQQHTQRLGDAVHRVAVHPLEDLAALLDRLDDHRKTLGQEHDGRRRPRRVRRARHGDAAVGFLERRGVVHSIAGHAHDVTLLLQDLHDAELVLGEHLREAVRALDLLDELCGRLMLGIAEAAGIEDVRAHPELLGGLHGDSQSIAGDHLDRHAHLAGGGDRGLGLGPRRVE